MWYQKNGFDQWSIARNQVRLYSKDESKVFSVDHLRMAYIEDLSDFHSFPKKASSITSWTLGALRVRRLERIGFRVFIVSERESFEALRDVMASKIFAFDDRDWDIFGGKPLDIALPLTLSVGENKANFKLGPVKKEELARDLESKDLKADELPEAAVLIDFDIYRTSPPFGSHNQKVEFLTFLDDSWKYIEAMSEAIMNHFGGFLNE